MLVMKWWCVSSYLNGRCIDVCSLRRLIRRDRLKAALRKMDSVGHQITARATREPTDPMLSNGSRGTLMSYTDHSVQHRLKSKHAYWHD